jgi:hypothetical protein
MNYAKESNIAVYEQDWMISHSNHFHAFKTELGFGETWLREMATAAAKHGLTIQYCMAPPAMWMAGIKYGNVTNVRGSNDYHPDWPHVYDMTFFTQSSILARALGLNPFKDVFFTTKRGIMWGERCPELETILSALSAGPVAPGDPIGHVNKTLVHACCRPDGVLLKPDRPLTAADIMFTRHEKYYICTTESRHGTRTWHYVLVANLWPKRVVDRCLTLLDLGITGKFVEYDFHKQSARVVSDSDKIELALRHEQHALRIYAPLLENGWALIGDAARYAMANDLTFKEIAEHGNGIKVVIEGIAGDTIEARAFAPTALNKASIDGVPLPAGVGRHDPVSGLVMVDVTFTTSGKKVLELE